MDLSPKIIPTLEAMPRGKQQDFAQHVRDGKLPRAALKAVVDQREPGEEDGSRNGAANGKPKNGAVLFDWRVFDATFGALLRQVDVLGNAFSCKESPDAEALRDKLASWKNGFKSLYLKVAGQEPPKE
jgi:hypothetical protein